MQRKTYSVNALALELELDRRTLAKRLEGLEPAELVSLGNRTSPRYHLRAVLDWLGWSPAATDAESGEDGDEILPARTEKDLLDRARRRVVEHELSERRGRYIETSEAIAIYAGQVVQAKTLLRGIGARLAPRLIGEEQAAVIKTKIDTEVDAALDALAADEESAPVTQV